ncbi:hypothetical protein PMAC_002165 [Pneumocystis sp. 'macacae']|nr:hypothetical protein PMAC_002165 [Pneumocystis sp. 'macacae']
MVPLSSFYDAVDALSEKFVERLSKAVSIPSISCSAFHRKYVIEMAEFLYKEMKNLNINVEKRFLGTQTLDNEEIELPPLVIGKYGDDKTKKNVLVYGDGWITDPWEFKYDEETGRMYGRGISDDKGPVLGWLNAIEAFQKAGIHLPVNLIFCMEENGSVGLDKFIEAEARKYFADVDYVCISDNYWLGTKKPCLTYGLRGISCYSVTVKGPSADLHSGVFGGIIHEPMTDLLFSSLVKPDGTILIPGIMDQVEPLSKDSLYDGISITMEDIHHSAGSKTTIYDKEKCILMHRYPSLSLHGIEGAFSSPGIKTVIPSKVSGKFSIRLVPNMNPEDVCVLVKKHLESVFLSLGSKNTLTIEYLHGSKAWVSSPDHPNYKAAAEATKKIYNIAPDFTREGGSIPVALTFETCLNKNVLLLPMGRGDDGAHSINEKLDKSNFIKGTKLFGTYLYEISIS